MNTATLDAFFKVRNNQPVVKQKNESDGIMQQLKDGFTTSARLQAFVIYRDEVFSLYSINGKYACFKQFNLDKLLSGYKDSLRKGWKDSTGKPISWDKMQSGINLEGAYVIFNNKKWVDLPGYTYELDIKFLPDEVKAKKAELLSGGNYLEGIDGKIAIINGKKYKLTLV